MAVVATPVFPSNDRKPDIRIVPVDLAYLAGDTYLTGGIAITPASLGFSVILAVIGVKSGGYKLDWDSTNNKLKLYSSNGASPAALLEVPNATDVSAVSPIRFIAIGIVV